MSALALFFALMLDQFRPLHSRHQVYGLLRKLALHLQLQLDAGVRLQAWVLWFLVALAPALAAWLVFALLNRWVGSFAAFTWMLLVAWAALDFRAFGLHFTQVRNAFNTGKEARASSALWAWRQFLARTDAGSNHQADFQDDGHGAGEGDVLSGVVVVSLIHIHRYVFGVFAAFSLLAFAGFGPMGAVLFRTAGWAHRNWYELQLTQQLPEQPSPALAGVARQAWTCINWVPARITGWTFAAVGRFDEAAAASRAYAQSLSGERAELESSVGRSAPRSPSDALMLAMACAAIGMQRGAIEQAMAWPSDNTPHSTMARAQDVAPRLLDSLGTTVWRVLLVWVMVWLVVALIDAVL